MLCGNSTGLLIIIKTSFLGLSNAFVAESGTVEEARLLDMPDLSDFFDNLDAVEHDLLSC